MARVAVAGCAAGVAVAVGRRDWQEDGFGEARVNLGWRLPEIVRLVEKRGDSDHIALLSRSKKFQIVLSKEAQDAAIDYAKKMREFGLYGLPFDECYFEVVFSDTRLGFLCWYDGIAIKSRKYSWSHKHGVSLADHTMRVPLETSEKPSLVTDFDDPTTRDLPSSFALLENRLSRMDIQRELCAVFHEMLPFHIDYIDSAIGSLSLRGAISTPSEKKRGPSQLNRRLPGVFFAHSVISVPTDTHALRAYGDGRIERNPVRLHWRRGHIRRLHNGNLTQVRPALIGDRSFGAISSEYVVSSRAA